MTNEPSDSTTLVDDALLLVEQNFYFLHAGEFYDALNRREDLSRLIPSHIVRQFDDGVAYTFGGELTRTVVQHDHEYGDETGGLFAYFVEFNAFRGIAMGMLEALAHPSQFQDFVQGRLGEVRYENFVDIVAFVRNVLSHNTHAEIRLNKKDYEGRRKRIARMRRELEVVFDFNYHDDLPEIAAPSVEYGAQFAVDFGALSESVPFLEILPMGKLMMLSELCFNLTVAYRNR
jgi:hypothetical protein